MQTDRHAPSYSRPSHRTAGRALAWGLVFLTSLVATLAVVWVLVVMIERKGEARQPFQRVVEINEATTDPVPWGKN